jgi:hypothetical protein
MLSQGRKSKAVHTTSAFTAPPLVPGRKMGIPTGNVAAALELLRCLARTFFVTAQQVDLLTEVFEDTRDKVWALYLAAGSLGAHVLSAQVACNPHMTRLHHTRGFTT